MTFKTPVLQLYQRKFFRDKNRTGMQTSNKRIQNLTILPTIKLRPNTTGLFWT